MSSPAVTEKAIKTKPKRGRLMIAAVVLLAGALVVLVAGVILMQEEIRSLRGTIEELKPLKDDVTEGDNKTPASRALAERGPARGKTAKGRYLRLSRTKRGQCEPIRIPLCQNMPYNSAQFPNLLNHRTQDEAIAVASKLGPGVTCSSSLDPFLCSLLAPPCNGTQKPIPPCKEFCKRSTKGCKDQLKKFQSTLAVDTALRCKHLPKEGVSTCFNGSWPKIINTPPPATGCRPITHQCNRYSPPPWKGQFPNYFGHMNDKVATVGFQKFDGIFQIIVDKDCSSLLANFLCGLYAPPCRATQNPLPPCRELCLEVRSQCKRDIKQAAKTIGFQWPSDLKCRNFPRKDEASCYNGPSTGEDTTMPQAGKCQVLTIPLCKNVPYNMTEFPNFFKHKTQEEAALEVHQFWPLVKVECSKDLAFFLCSLYAPLCSTLDKPPLPCGELCRRVQRGCLPLLQKFGYSWPDRMSCDIFPNAGDGVCIDRPNTVDVTTPPPIPSKAGKCEPLSVSKCSGLHYSQTWVPNYFQHQTQDQAALEISKFDPIIQTNCSEEFTFFLCSLYAPNCNPYTQNVPCKELCSRVKKRCVPRMRELGIKWPVSCSKFPRKTQEPECISGPPSPRVTMTTNEGRCEAMTIIMCNGLHYNMALFPNFFNQSQEQATQNVHQFFPLVKYGCSPELPLLLCSLYAPPCSAPRKPCKELCNRVRNSCHPIMSQFGFSWPGSMACDKFPTASQGTECIGAQRSVPSTATPTTLPDKR